MTAIKSYTSLEQSKKLATGIGVRLLCSILFVLSIPFIPIQLIWYGLKFIITGDSRISSPIPFLIVDYIMNWYNNK